MGQNIIKLIGRCMIRNFLQSPRNYIVLNSEGYWREAIKIDKITSFTTAQDIGLDTKVPLFLSICCTRQGYFLSRENVEFEF